MVLMTPEGKVLEVDDRTAEYNKFYMPVIELEHHKIHDGVHFSAYDYDADVDIAGPKYWHIITPNTAALSHFLFEVRSGGPGLLEFFEGPTTSGDGTTVVVYNNDRGSATVSALLVYYDPTVTTDGTRLMASFMGTVGAAPVGDTGGIAERNSELILKTNTKYFVKFTPTNDTTQVSVGMNWYDDADG